MELQTRRSLELHPRHSLELQARQSLDRTRVTAARWI
jgi:hypothetical protein